MADRDDQALFPAWRVVSVPVATVWTSPSSPRALDAPALAGFATGGPGVGKREVKGKTDLGNPMEKETDPEDGRGSGIEAWIAAMTVQDKLDLCEANRVQTQALYGTPVLAYEELDGWSRIAIPSQSSPKDENGYPGWIPTEQLLKLSEEEALRLLGSGGSVPGAAAAPASAIVTAHAADLELLSSSAKMSISFLTKLPLAIGKERGTGLEVESSDEAQAAPGFQAETVAGTDAGAFPQAESVPKEGAEAGADYREDSFVVVQTPHGLARIKRADVQVAAEPGDYPESLAEGRNKGQAIVAQAKRFLGLPYLWGGTSAWGYDCSGFAHSMHLACGIVIPRDASVQALHGASIPREELQPGDLLFFAHEQGKGRVHHVGIYAGDGHMIHSPDSASSVELIPLKGYKLADEHCVSRRYWT
ncbi:cell wall-associated NlpC family hydrolase [Paenibacillus rhizosphaerae]|uniref:Cell wall-associated NlpC family hydrolase n=1 Tax=Paenibacillus rhizosphaerae TaxID=297318 RepID=A0A839TIQ7_9BACL|nr:NlpC/P60 family protein [Paenibacillus rhizosphaerae]MBB3125640.1 cell wall-associated NlpC family hydrolase [Paenibacillus rhizosphaerae]